MADTSPILDTQIYVKIFSSMETAGNQMSTALVSDGTSLAFVLFGILLFYRFFQMSIGDGPAAVAKVVNDLFKLGIVLMLLALWGTVVLSTFTTEFTNLAQKVTASQGSVDVAASIYNTVKRVWNGGDHGDDTDCTTVEFGETSGVGGVDPNASSQGSAKVTDCKSKTTKQVSLWKAVLMIPMGFISLLFKLVVTFLLGVLFVVYLVQVNIGMVLTICGMCAGPILVPFFVWSFTEFLFSGWLKFMIVAGLFKVAGAIISVLVDVSVKTAFSVTSAIVGDAADYLYFDLVALFTVGVIAGIGILFMREVPMIANGLVAGNAGMAGRGVYQSVESQMSGKNGGGNRGGGRKGQKGGDDDGE